jgi:putative PIN family toxin of toxin-antitoxin system
LKAVIDTNVVYAGLLNRKGAAYKIIRRFFGRQFDWINSPTTLDEYHDVLSASWKLPSRRVQSFLLLIKTRSTLVQIAGNLQICKDTGDDKFLETAVVGNADFLVTKNLNHFPHKSYQGVRIVKVAKFLKVLEKLFP